MLLALVLTVAVIVAAPFVALFGGWLLQGIVFAVLAVALASVAWKMPSGEARHMAKLARPFAIGLAIPVIWILIQAVPMPFSGLTHPIWASAAEALAEPLQGRISIDPGVTLIALARCLCLMGVFAVALSIAIERRRAEILLLCVTGSAAISALIVIALAVTHSSPGAPIGSQGSIAPLIAMSAIGLPVAIAAAGHMFERFERQRARKDNSVSGLREISLGCACVFALCVFELFSAASQRVLAVAGIGFAVIAGVFVLRRFNISGWFGAAVAAVAIIIGGALAIALPTGTESVSLRYSEAPAASIELAANMLRDTSWAGAGAGTFPILFPVYRQDGGAVSEVSAPTAASQIYVELGGPVFWILAAMAVALAGYLLRSSITRGRDYYYPAAASAAIVVLLLDAFINSGGLDMSVGIVTAALVGAGVAQSVGRSAQ